MGLPETEKETEESIHIIFEIKIQYNFLYNSIHLLSISNLDSFTYVYVNTAL